MSLSSSPEKLTVKASLISLPTELLLGIVCGIPGIDHFDPIRKRYLRALRLTCHRLRDIATPLLFENMVLDAKSIRKLCDFASAKPELAKHVRRVQIAMPPANLARQNSRFEGMLRRMDESESPVVKALSLANRQRFYDLLFSPLRGWLDDMRNRKPLPPKIAQATTDSLQIFENLQHVEVVLSQYYYQHQARASQQFFDETGYAIEDFYHNSELPVAFGLWTGSAMALSGAPPQVTSMKLRELPLNLEFGSLCLSNLHIQLVHLDLELRVFGGVEMKYLKDYIKQWRLVLRNLQQVQTLRLSLANSREYVRSCPNNDKYKLYLDDLFLDDDDDDEAHHPTTGNCHFPKLKCLTLTNWAVKKAVLRHLIYAHKDTLKELNLERLTLPSAAADIYDDAWPVVAVMCQKYIPGIERLHFDKLSMHNKLEGEPDDNPEDLVDVEILEAESDFYEFMYRVAKGEEQYSGSDSD